MESSIFLRPDCSPPTESQVHENCVRAKIRLDADHPKTGSFHAETQAGESISLLPGAGRAKLSAKSSGYGNLVEWLVTVSIKSAGQPRMALAFFGDRLSLDSNFGWPKAQS